MKNISRVLVAVVLFMLHIVVTAEVQDRCDGRYLSWAGSDGLQAISSYTQNTSDVVVEIANGALHIDDTGSNAAMAQFDLAPGTKNYVIQYDFKYIPKLNGMPWFTVHNDSATGIVTNARLDVWPSYFYYEGVRIPHGRILDNTGVQYSTTGGNDYGQFPNNVWCRVTIERFDTSYEITVQNIENEEFIVYRAPHDAGTGDMSYLRFSTGSVSFTDESEVYVNNIKVGQAITKGHSILIDKGLQIQAIVYNFTDDFAVQTWDDTNFTAIHAWTKDLDARFPSTIPDRLWGRGAALQYASEFLNSAEQQTVNRENLVFLHYGDEQNLSDPVILAATQAWFDQARTLYPDVLLFTNQWGRQWVDQNWTGGIQAMYDYMAAVNPDMVMFDVYPFFENSTETGSLSGWFKYLQDYRLLGLRGNDGTGKHPVPYGVYLQTVGEDVRRLPSESEFRLQQFAAWAFGYKFSGAFTYEKTGYPDCESLLFEGAGSTVRRYPQFNQYAEMNRQSLKLSPALTRLLSTDVRIVAGQHNGVTNALPDNVSAWNSSVDPYITSMTATNLGNYNAGYRGDVIIGYFKPLDRTLVGAGEEDEIYFMLVNGLKDMNASASETRQKIIVDFDFGSSGITSLQRLNRLTGVVETMPLVQLGSTTYRLEVIYDGGTGDLFKFNTSKPFIGFAD